MKTNLMQCQRAAVQQPENEPLSRPQFQDFSQERLCFQLVSMRYDSASGLVLARGRTAQGKSVAIHLHQCEFDAYIQQHRPFKDDQEACSMLEQLVQTAQKATAVQVPIAGDYSKTETVTMSYHMKQFQISGWARADGVHKSFYGWTPDEERLEGLLRIWVRDPRQLKLLSQLVESMEYRAQTHHFLRTFYASLDPLVRFRIRQGVTMGGWCELSAYRTIETGSKEQLLYADFSVATLAGALIPMAEAPNASAPLRICSLDIECAGRPGQFPVPLITLRALKQAAISLGMPERLIGPYITTVEQLRQLVQNQPPADQERYAAMPSDTDTDPCFLVCMVDRHLGEDQDLYFSQIHAILYVHPRQKEPYDRSAHPYTTDSGNRTVQHDQICRMVVEEVHTEAELLLAVMRRIHLWCPDILTNWNGLKFDLPYLLERYEYLLTYGSNYERQLLQAEKCNFGMRIGGESWGQYKVSSTNAGGDRSYMDVSTEHLIHMDGMEVLQNPSFGIKSSSYTLNKISEQYLTYPGTKIPRRKIDADVRMGSQYWENGGAGLWFFIIYCFVDACLPVHIMEDLGKFRQLIAIGRIANIDLMGVYHRGMQVKIVGLLAGGLHQETHDLRLLPDWGRRCSHHPDIWLEPNMNLAWRRVLNDARFQPIPEGKKGYMGARVFEPTRGLNIDPVATLDFTSLYPSIIISSFLCFALYLTERTIDHYKIPRHHYTEVILGGADLIYCGEECYDPQAALEMDECSPKLKRAFWMADNRNHITRRILLRLMDKRNEYKRAMAEWKYHREVLKMGETAMPVDESQRVLFEEAIGKFWASRLVQAASNSDSWTKAYQETCSRIPSNLDALRYATMQVEENDAGQLAIKIYLNSIYGFTTVPQAKAILPCTELGASVTSHGRTLITLTAICARHYRVTDLERIVAERIESNDMNMTSLLTLDPALRQHILELLVPPVEATKHDRLQIRGGDTDSAMLGFTHVTDAKRLKPLVEWLARRINHLMPDLMSLEPEKISWRTIFFSKKTYMMMILGETKEINKGSEMTRRDSLPLLRKIMAPCLDIILNRTEETRELSLSDTLQYLKNHIRTELERFIRDDYSIYDLVLSKQLRKLHYKVAPDVMGAVNNIRERGGHVDVGDRVEYVFAMDQLSRERLAKRNVSSYHKPRGTDITEEAAYAIENDIKLAKEHYWIHKLEPGLTRFISRIFHQVTGYPSTSFAMTPEEVKKVKKDQEVIKKAQKRLLDETLYDDTVNKVFSEERILQWKRAKLDKPRSKQYDPEVRHRWLCAICNCVYTHGDDTRGDRQCCPQCEQARPELIMAAQTEQQHCIADIEDALQTCHMCIAQTGLEGQLTPEQCGQYTCSIYSRRRANAVRQQQLDHRLRILV